MKKYLKGHPHILRYGGKWGEDRAVLSFYGDQNNPSAPWIMQAATAEIPDEAVLSNHQKLALHFAFAEVRPYGEILELLERVTELMKQNDWQEAQRIDGSPSSGSTIDFLEECWDFPEEPNFDFNAAGGFTVVLEKRENNPFFSECEQEKIMTIMEEAMVIVFGAYALPQQPAGGGP